MERMDLVGTEIVNEFEMQITMRVPSDPVCFINNIHG